MSTEFNLCPKCGGVKSLKQPEHTGRVHTSIFKACICPPKTVPNRDGRAVTRYGEREFMVHVRQGNFALTSIEALSLLAELEQERETLQRLAKEQENQ